MKTVLIMSYITGEVTLSPSGTALVCDGGQLELTCTVTGRILEWRVCVMPETDSPLRRLADGSA